MKIILVHQIQDRIQIFIVKPPADIIKTVFDLVFRAVVGLGKGAGAYKEEG